MEPRLKPLGRIAFAGDFMANSLSHRANGQALNNGANPLNAGFSVFAHKTASWAGHPVAFLLAAAVIVVWVVTGPVFGYSDTWQLVINTGTTIVTFLMVFLIQNTQNRDMLTMQLKLSELVLALKGAENKFAAIEDLSDEELEALHNECRARAEQTRDHLEVRRGKNENAAAGGKVRHE
jgi:low affinity Fe/Cu permease